MIVNIENILYFLINFNHNKCHFPIQGEWANKFDPARTNKDEFTKTNGEKVPVDMMWIKKKFQVLDHRDLGCQILEMPYKVRPSNSSD